MRNIGTKWCIAILFVCILAVAVRGEETVLEIGPSQVGDNYSNNAMLTLSQRWDDKYQLTLGYIGKQEVALCDRIDCVWETDEQVFFGGEVLFKPLWFWTDRFKFGIGPYIKTRPDRFVSSFLMVGLYAEYEFTDWFALAARHFSNSSSGFELRQCNKAYNDAKENNSLEWLMPYAVCQTHDFNIGHDSWLRLQLTGRF